MAHKSLLKFDSKYLFQHFFVIKYVLQKSFCHNICFAKNLFVIIYVLQKIFLSSYMCCKKSFCHHICVANFFRYHICVAKYLSLRLNIYLCFIPESRNIDEYSFCSAAIKVRIHTNFDNATTRAVD